MIQNLGRRGVSDPPPTFSICSSLIAVKNQHSFSNTRVGKLGSMWGHSPDKNIATPLVENSSRKQGLSHQVAVETTQESEQKEDHGR